MGTTIVEQNLRFDFGNGWTQIFPWDRHRVYTGGMSHSELGKGVDFVGIYEGTVPFLIEAKDYRYHARSPEKGPIEFEFELKVRSTIAALVGAHARQRDDDCVRLFDSLIESRRPSLVLWLEEPRPERTTGPAIGKRRQARSAMLAEQIKRKMKWLDANTLITSVSDGYSRIIPDVIVTDLPPERKEKADMVVATLAKNGIKLPNEVKWRILDCLDLAQLDELLERAPTVRNAWKLFSSRP